MTNPFQIGFNPPTDVTLKELMSKMPTDQRVKLQKLIDTQNEDEILANKTFLASFVNSNVFYGLTAGDNELSKKLEEMKKKAPEAWIAGDIAALAVPGAPIAKVAGAGAKFAGKLGSAIVNRVSKPTAKLAADIARFGLEGAGAVAFNDALNTEKFMNAYRQNNGDLLKTIQQRSNEVRQVAQEGFGWAAATGVVVKTSTLPAKLQKQNIERLNRELEAGKKIEYRRKGIEQRELSKFINAPKAKTDDFFDTYGIELEDALAGIEMPESPYIKTFTGTREQLQGMTKSTGKNLTFMDRYSKLEEDLLKTPQMQEKLSLSDLNDIFEGAYKEIATAESVSKELATELTGQLNDFRKKITPGMSYADLARKMDDYNAVARTFRDQQKIGAASIAEQIGKGMRRAVVKKIPEFNKINATKRGLMIANETLGTQISSQAKGTTLRDLSRSELLKTASDLTEGAAAKIGIDSRDLTDMLGSTTMKSSTLDKFKDLLKQEEQIKSSIRSKGVGSVLAPQEQIIKGAEQAPAIYGVVGTKVTENEQIPMEGPISTNLDVDSILNDLGIPKEEEAQLSPTETEQQTEDMYTPTATVDSILEDLGV